MSWLRPLAVFAVATALSSCFVAAAFTPDAGARFRWGAFLADDSDFLQSPLPDSARTTDDDSLLLHGGIGRLTYHLPWSNEYAGRRLAIRGGVDPDCDGAWRINVSIDGTLVGSRMVQRRVSQLPFPIPPAAPGTTSRTVEVVYNTPRGGKSTCEGLRISLIGWWVTGVVDAQDFASDDGSSPSLVASDADAVGDGTALHLDDGHWAVAPSAFTDLGDSTVEVRLKPRLCQNQPPPMLEVSTDGVITRHKFAKDNFKSEWRSVYIKTKVNRRFALRIGNPGGDGSCERSIDVDEVISRGDPNDAYA